MEISTYRGILLVTYIFIIVDIVINTLSLTVRLQNVHELLLYVVQDTIQVFTIVVIFLLFSNTYLFQVGFLGLLIIRFRLTIACSLIYLALSIPIHIILLRMRWDDIYAYVFSDTVKILLVLHRTVSGFHYYLFKRTVLRLSDSRFYESTTWIQEQMKSRD